MAPRFPSGGNFGTDIGTAAAGLASGFLASQREAQRRAMEEARLNLTERQVAVQEQRADEEHTQNEIENKRYEEMQQERERSVEASIRQYQDLRQRAGLPALAESDVDSLRGASPEVINNRNREMLDLINANTRSAELQFQRDLQLRQESFQQYSYALKELDDIDLEIQAVIDQNFADLRPTTDGRQLREMALQLRPDLRRRGMEAHAMLSTRHTQLNDLGANVPADPRMGTTIADTEYDRMPKEYHQALEQNFDKAMRQAIEANPKLLMADGATLAMDPTLSQEIAGLSALGAPVSALIDKTRNEVSAEMAKANDARLGITPEQRARINERQNAPPVNPPPWQNYENIPLTDIRGEPNVYGTDAAGFPRAASTASGSQVPNPIDPTLEAASKSGAPRRVKPITQGG